MSWGKHCNICGALIGMCEHTEPRKSVLVVEAPEFAGDVPDAFKGLCLLKVSDVGICGSDAEWHVIRKDLSATEVCGAHLDAARWQADYRHQLTDDCLAADSYFVPALNRCVDGSHVAVAHVASSVGRDDPGR